MSVFKLREYHILTILTFLLGGFLSSGCTPQNHKTEFIVFGTIVNLEISGETKQTAQKTSDLIQTEFDQLHTRWHAWQKGGLLAKINTAIANDKPIKLVPKVVDFLQTAQKLSQQSDYYFNPAIGHLISLWGFHDNQKNILPDPKKIQFFTKPPLNLDALEFTDNTLTSADNRIKIDMGAIAKGYAAMLAINILKSQQIKNAIINVGGDLSVLGTKNSRAWRVGVRHPDGGIIGHINIHNGESIVSSGNYERTYQINKHKVHHIINPRIGYPATGIRAVTVIDKNATKADAAATAILAGGLLNWKKIIQQMSLDLVLIVTDKNQIKMTAKMQHRI